MTGLPLKKRCQRDESLAAAGPAAIAPTPSALLEAANALTELFSGTPTATPTASDDDESESDDNTIETAASGYTSSSSSIVSAANNKSSATFPEKLMEIVQSESQSAEDPEAAIAWLPSGDGFLIPNSKKFTLDVLPKYFNNQRTEFSSFTRKLYWWGFKKTSRGLNCGDDSFRHELFRRDEPSLCRKMRGRCSGSRSGGGSGRKRKSKQARDQVKDSRTTATPSPPSRGSQSPALDLQVVSSSGQGICQPPPTIVKSTPPPPQQQQAQAQFLAQQQQQLEASQFLMMQLQLQAAAQAQAQAAQQAKAYQLAIGQAHHMLLQSQRMNLGGSINNSCAAALQQQHQHQQLPGSLQMPAVAATTTAQVLPANKASPTPQQVVIHIHHHRNNKGGGEVSMMPKASHSPYSQTA